MQKNQRQKLTDLKKKKIIAEYVKQGNYSAVAREYGVSRTTVKKIVENNSDITELMADKYEKNTQDILAYMDSKRDKIYTFIDKYLDLFMDKNKLDEASINQLSTAFGTVIDKFTRAGGAAEEKNGKLSELIEGVKK